MYVPEGQFWNTVRVAHAVGGREVVLLSQILLVSEKHRTSEAP